MEERVEDFACQGSIDRSPQRQTFRQQEDADVGRYGFHWMGTSFRESDDDLQDLGVL